MSYLNVSDLAVAPSFQARVAVAIATYAGTVLTTPQGDMPTAQFEKRIAYANDVVRNPQAITPAFIWPILSNTTIASKGLDSEDSDILYQVSQVWDTMSGVTAADKTAPTT